jgi:hypothetical protein
VRFLQRSGGATSLECLEHLLPPFRLLYFAFFIFSQPCVRALRREVFRAAFICSPTMGVRAFSQAERCRECRRPSPRSPRCRYSIPSASIKSGTRKTTEDISFFIAPPNPSECQRERHRCSAVRLWRSANMVDTRCSCRCVRRANRERRRKEGRSDKCWSEIQCGSSPSVSMFSCFESVNCLKMRTNRAKT